MTNRKWWAEFLSILADWWIDILFGVASFTLMCVGVCIAVRLITQK